MNASVQLDQLPTPVVAGIVVLIIIQLALQITALLQLGRTPAERVSIGGRRWAWALIILLGEIVGPILWFALGRTPVTLDDSARDEASSQEAAGEAADVLYGERADRSE